MKIALSSPCGRQGLLAVIDSSEWSEYTYRSYIRWPFGKKYAIDLPQLALLISMK